MEWLNYHHLLYFWVVAREGSIVKASAVLRLSHPTISAQIKTLEASLGESLFRRVGRRLVLTEMGTVAFRYADEIFATGRELLETVRGRPTGRPARLVVGVADVLPKLVVRRLLEPARHLPEPVRIVCREDAPERLVASLAQHSLDVVLSDAPLSPGSPIRAFHHLLGECAVAFFGARALARRARRRFPHSLADVPVLLPTENTTLRRSLDSWMAAMDVRPRIAAEFDDSALLKAFGEDGAGVFPAPVVISRALRAHYGAYLVGRVPEVRERFFAITMERRLKNPAVAAICDGAREDLFS
jgi:LysR family transcriptional activator of nhaA